MSMKSIHGLRFGPDGAACDIPPADRTNTTVKGTGVLMHGDDTESQFGELIVVAQCGLIDATHNTTVKVQESDVDSDGDYADVPGASIPLTSVNSDELFVVNVDWRHPDRKKFARAVLVEDANASGLTGVATIRALPYGGDLEVDDNVTEVY